MRKQEKDVQNRKRRNTIIAISALSVVVGYAVFAQPLAYNAVLRGIKKVTDVFVPWNNNSNKNDISTNTDNNDSNNNDKGNKNTQNNNKTGETNSGNAGTSNPVVSDKWNISFTKAINTGVYGSAREITPVTFDALSASFNVALTDPEDKIVYEFTITNKGQLNAKVEDIRFVPEESNDMIEFKTSGIAIGDKLAVGESTTMIVTISYNNPANDDVKYYNKSAKIIIDYVQD